MAELSKSNSKSKEINFINTVLKILSTQLRENIVLVLTIFGVITGLVLGFILRSQTNFKPPTKKYFGVPGDLFLRALKFLILPLISTSLITGIGGIGLEKTGKVAVRTFVFYTFSTFSAVVMGLILVTTIKPGIQGKGALRTITPNPYENRKVSPLDNFIYILKNLIPENMIEMGFEVLETKIIPRYKSVYNQSNSNISNQTKTIKVIDYYEPVDSRRRGINVLGLVIFSATFGAMLTRVGPKGHIVLEFFDGLNAIFGKVFQLVMIFSPIGICSLICQVILEMEDPELVFKKMEDPELVFKSISFFIMTVLIGFFLHGTIILPAAYVIMTRKNVLRFAKNMSEALVVAFATASSAATIPITFKCIEEKNKISKIISRFVLPIGATANIDGTALYEAVASIFIAQLYGMNLTFIDMLVTSFTATIATMGAAGMPSAGLVALITVLSNLSIPASQVTLIYAVDWFLDRFRTMINVWGDSIATGVVAHLSKKEIEDFEERKKKISESDSQAPPLVKFDLDADKLYYF
ncbi:unnamed protein product [Brachionus calyciflorus]|uniref:Amino acid transporter n=1 Tax=Brachionus calyciflorus TaxID=104777 RepID=A0A814KPL3_9BILA|nr:unnamed protein product [Brachionus calyciflorus]